MANFLSTNAALLYLRPSSLHYIVAVVTLTTGATVGYNCYGSSLPGWKPGVPLQYQAPITELHQQQQAVSASNLMQQTGSDYEEAIELRKNPHTVGLKQ